MNFKKRFAHSRKLAGETTVWCALFEFLNTVCVRLNLKAKWGIPVRFRRDADIPFYMRLGTTDWETFNVTFLLGEYEFVRDQISVPRTILDLGANIGDSARYFVDLYPGVKIFAIEPDAGNAAICSKNLERLKSSERMSCKKCFVGAEAGYAGMDRSAGEWGYSMNREAPGPERIPIVTMPDLLRELNLAEIDLLKCDIEGAEAELFRDCSSWISAIRNLVIETSPPYSVAILEEDLADSGIRFAKLHHVAPDGVHELALFCRMDTPPLRCLKSKGTISIRRRPTSGNSVEKWR